MSNQKKSSIEFLSASQLCDALQEKIISATNKLLVENGITAFSYNLDSLYNYTTQGFLIHVETVTDNGIEIIYASIPCPTGLGIEGVNDKAVILK